MTCTWPFHGDPACPDCARYEARWQDNADMHGRGTLAASFTVHGEPVSKQRARVTGRGTYTPAKTREAEAEVRNRYFASLDLLASDADDRDEDGSYAVHITFTNGNRRRRDLDNMTKLVLDALNGVAWVDDVQVVEIRATKVQGERGQGRTDVQIWRLNA